MSHVVDLTGMDFGYLHVIGRDTSRKGDTAHWICRCKCGTICSAWSCTECRFCPERKFTRQSRREVITL